MILLVPADRAIRYGKITIPQVRRHEDPELKPSMNDSGISAFFSKFIPAHFHGQDKSGQLKTNVAA